MGTKRSRQPEPSDGEGNRHKRVKGNLPEQPTSDKRCNRSTDVGRKMARTHSSRQRRAGSLSVDTELDLRHTAPEKHQSQEQLATCLPSPKRSQFLTPIYQPISLISRSKLESWASHFDTSVLKPLPSIEAFSGAFEAYPETGFVQYLRYGDQLQAMRETISKTNKRPYKPYKISTPGCSIAPESFRSVDFPTTEWEPLSPLMEVYDPDFGYRVRNRFVYSEMTDKGRRSVYGPEIAETYPPGFTPDEMQEAWTHLVPGPKENLILDSPTTSPRYPHVHGAFKWRMKQRHMSLVDLSLP